MRGKERHPKETNVKRGGRERMIFWGTSLAYFLVALEVLFMITPFALYFYGVYGPILEFLSSHRLTAWTVEFFLPHMVFVDDPLLIGISWLQALFVIGLVLFLLAAIPLYIGRLTGRGVVTFGPYARIRHPQYLFLAISGLGLLLYWPRFIVLLFYLFMLFAYFFLACNEEWRMKREQPGQYDEYMARTWMFLPGEPGGRVYRGIFGWLRSRVLGLSLLVLLVFGLAVGGAFALRRYSLGRLPQAWVGDMQLVSVYPRPMQEVKDLYRLAAGREEVRRAVAAKQMHLAYVMPGDFFLTGLILREGPRYSEVKLKQYPYLRDPEAHRHSGGLEKFFRLGYKYYQTIGSTRRVYDYERLVFVETLGLDGRPVPAGQALALGVRRYPALVVDIDAETHDVLAVTPVSGQNAWGRLPMPNI
jgi:protein-S-isoprenylcysteine O-methyltransferase Ste14